MRSTILSRQSLLDIALQEGGSVEAALELAIRNGLSVSDELIPGEGIEVAVGDIKQKRVVEYYNVHGIRPATAITSDELEETPCGGIGYMGIGIDFIIS